MLKWKRGGANSICLPYGNLIVSFMFFSKKIQRFHYFFTEIIPCLVTIKQTLEKLKNIMFRVIITVHNKQYPCKLFPNFEIVHLLIRISHFMQDICKLNTK